MNTLANMQKVTVGEQPYIYKEGNNKKTSTIVSAKAPLPANNEYELLQVQKHTSEPIKDVKDIVRISNYLISQKRYRDNMLFILGCNFGLRCGDLLKVHVYDVVDSNGVIKDSFNLIEQKTKNTKGRSKCMIDLYAYKDMDSEQLTKLLSEKIKESDTKKVTPKVKTVYINKAAKYAIKLYLDNTKVFLDDFLFRSQSNNGGNTNQPLSRKSVDRILKKIMSDLNVDVRAGTHLMRKTFGYNWMVQHNNDPDALKKLQKIFNHSSPNVTMRYIGITDEDIKNGLMDLNLGVYKA